MDQQRLSQLESVLKAHHYHILKKLGRGAYSEVFSVIYTKNQKNQIYSVKCVNKKELAKKHYNVKYISQQIQSMKEVKHSNFVQFVRSFDDRGWIFIVMEYCDKSNLSAYQNYSPSRLVPFNQAMHIIVHVLEGLKYLHSKNLIHRDIKAENVLLQTNKSNQFSFIAKICDLGFCRQDDQNATTFCGTTSYMAPQIFKKTTYGSKVDVWSVGVLLFKMLFGQFPFKGLSMEHDIATKSGANFNLFKIKAKNNPTISEENLQILNQLFKKIFEVDPKQRLSIEQILQSPLFSSRPNSPEDLRDSKNAKKLSQDEIQGEDRILEIIQFMDRIYKNQIVKLKLLKPFEQKCLELYIRKVKLCIFDEVKQKKEQYRQLYQKIKQQIQQNVQNQRSIVRQCKSLNFEIAYKPKFKTFLQIKQPFRLLVSFAFKQSMTIRNQQYRAKLKVELICLHLINRVFQKEYRDVIFKNYMEWNEKKNKNIKFTFASFNNWLKQAQIQSLSKTVDTLHNTFYKEQRK